MRDADLTRARLEEQLRGTKLHRFTPVPRAWAMA